jgi:hypothetical protein
MNDKESDQRRDALLLRLLEDSSQTAHRAQAPACREGSTMATTKTEGSVRRKAAADARKLRLEANQSAQNQFAALGRFIQSFEGIVGTLRWHSHRIMLGDHLGITNPDTKVLLSWWNITSMIFHYETITAKPLLDIWRSLHAEECIALKRLEILSEEGDKVVKGVSGEIASEFEEIYQQRNRLIHATWRIGRWAPFEEFSELGVEKYKVGADGFTKRTDLPKNFDELMEWGTRCQRLHNKIARFLQFYHYQPKDIETVFAYSKAAEKGQRWKFIPPTSSAAPATSRRKSK